MKTLIESAAAAKAASTAVAQLTKEQKNAALLAMAGAGIYFLLFPAQFQPLASRFAANNSIAELNA